MGIDIRILEKGLHDIRLIKSHNGNVSAVNPELRCVLAIPSEAHKCMVRRVHGQLHLVTKDSTGPTMNITCLSCARRHAPAAIHRSAVEPLLRGILTSPSSATTVGVHVAVVSIDVAAFQDTCLKTRLHICPVTFVRHVVRVNELANDIVILAYTIGIDSSVISSIRNTPLNINDVTGIICCDRIEAPIVVWLIPVDHIAVVFLTTWSHIADTLAGFRKRAHAGVVPVIRHIRHGFGDHRCGIVDITILLRKNGTAYGRPKDTVTRGKGSRRKNKKSFSLFD
mmetsp:Transcript_2641/g.4824  ORF Transcript_2641/g.4824 Transcript_2641/m.4824 type:complete len:282 (-) Transcript_2641:36-881(-)